MNKNILIVYIEPTPYILSLVYVLEKTWQGEIDIIFLSENISQSWNLELKNKYKILSGNFIKKIRFVVNIFFKKRYCLIHLAGWGNFYLVLLLFIAKFKNIPVSIESDTPFSKNTVFWKRFIKRVMYPALFRLVDLFLPGGSRQAKYIKHYGVSIKNIFPVQMTVDIDKMRSYASTLDRLKIRKELSIENECIVFLYVGRLEPYKGITDLLTAFQKTQCKSAVLLIVGDGNLKNFVESAAKFDNRIRYLSRLFGDQLTEIYFSADVLVLPSRREAWGLVVNEAMALALPVIVSDRVGCIDDLVVDHENGLIVLAEEINELRNAMEYMIQEPTMRKIMGHSGTKKISEWTLENEANKICQAWRQLDPI